MHRWSRQASAYSGCRRAMSASYKRLTVDTGDGELRIQLNRPEVHNALNAELIAELMAALGAVPLDGSVRAVVLSGAGRSFCAGGDLRWMQTVADFSREENVADGERLWDMLYALYTCPVPTIAAVHGAALGGGAGLVACCDVAVASTDAVFGFTEAKLGILPAVVSPFVLQKVGRGHARALFMTAQRFDASRAERIGLVHSIVPPDQLHAAVQRQVSEIRSSGPRAAGAVRGLIADVALLPVEQTRPRVTSLLAELRASAEGREGIRAFLERRRPGWMEHGQ